MNSVDAILIIKAFMWLLFGVIPFLVGLVILSCWLRNRAHHQQHEQMEQIMMQQFNAFSQTGNWPEAQTREEQKAMKMLAKRLDLHDSVRQTTEQTA
jgi:hypothetical protein